MPRKPSALDKRLPELRANLRALYARATQADILAGSAWYPNARRIVDEWSTHYGYSRETVAAVIAAISPQCPWERNLIIADDVLAMRPASVSCIRLNLEKAIRLRNEDRIDIGGRETRRVQNLDTLEERMTRQFPGGPKVGCFALNLAGNDNVVTVDTHAAQAALADVTSTLTVRWAVYRPIATAYAEAAVDVGRTAAEFQAILWHTWKREYPPELKRRHRTQWNSDDTID